MTSFDKTFEQRKQDHIQHALNPDHQALEMNDFDLLKLMHEALPDGDFCQIDLTTQRLGQVCANPFFVSSMTAGHKHAFAINHNLMQACQERGWWMGVGSQRRELHQDSDLDVDEWKNLRKLFPDVKLMSNLGVAQIIHTPLSSIKKIIDSLQACALIIHCNPLQEVIQPEGTPAFKGAYQAIERLVTTLSLPVVVKETGCGFSAKTLRRLNDCGVHAIDVSGGGGTHWGRIEGARCSPDSRLQKMAQIFKQWGISTVSSLMAARSSQLKSELWASGGIRHGLDAAKALALGASSVGFAKLLLEPALKSAEAVGEVMLDIELALKIAMFCSGAFRVHELKNTDLEWIVKP